MNLTFSKRHTIATDAADTLSASIACLVAALDQCVVRPSVSWTELELIKHLQAEHGFFPELTFADTESLYRVHFLIFHALYALRDELETSRELSLDIHTLNIRCRPYQYQSNTLPDAHDGLADFYRTLDNLAMPSEAIEAMVAGVWSKLQDRGETSNALALLDLDHNASHDDIKKQYRRLSSRHHPDRGGDAAVFQRIDQAYRLVKRVYAFH